MVTPTQPLVMLLWPTVYTKIICVSFRHGEMVSRYMEVAYLSDVDLNAHAG